MGDIYDGSEKKESPNKLVSRNRNECHDYHGMTDTKVHRVWRSIKYRCYNPNCPDFERYGGRGITMCDRWRYSFIAFYRDMGDPPPEHSIDRIDNNGNYEPGNCKWSTRQEQNKNKRPQPHRYKTTKIGTYYWFKTRGQNHG